MLYVPAHYNDKNTNSNVASSDFFYRLPRPTRAIMVIIGRAVILRAGGAAAAAAAGTDCCMEAVLHCNF